MKQHYSKIYHCAEQGFYLILAPLLILTVLLIFGLAIDTGRIYQAHLRVQRSVDAAAIAASKLAGTADDSKALGLAEEIIWDNLKSMGYDAGDVQSVSATWVDPLRKTTIQAQAQLKVPLMFMNLAPGSSKFDVVSASAQGMTQRAIVVLTMDLSGSMGPSKEDRDAGDTEGRKMRALKAAAISFINRFHEGEDYLGLVTFSNVASIPNKGSETGDITTRFKKKFEDIIKDFAPIQKTNTQHALWLAHIQIRNARSSGLTAEQYAAANKAIILITDGAPTNSCPETFDGKPLAIADCTEDNRDQRISEVHYDRAILQADSARADDITVYTIGIGKKEGGTYVKKSTNARDGSDKTVYLDADEFERYDAYQDYTKDQPLKSNFLRRVANVPNPFSEPFKKPFAPGKIKPYDQYNRPGEPDDPIDGLFLPTADGSDLDNLLTSIGLDIKGRLIQ